MCLCSPVALLCMYKHLNIVFNFAALLGDRCLSHSHICVHLCIYICIHTCIHYVYLGGISFVFAFFYGQKNNSQITVLDINHVLVDYKTWSSFFTL